MPRSEITIERACVRSCAWAAIGNISNGRNLKYRMNPKSYQLRGRRGLGQPKRAPSGRRRQAKLPARVPAPLWTASGDFLCRGEAFRRRETDMKHRLMMVGHALACHRSRAAMRRLASFTRLL